MFVSCTIKQCKRHVVCMPAHFFNPPTGALNALAVKNSRLAPSLLKSEHNCSDDKLMTHLHTLFRIGITATGLAI